MRKSEEAGALVHHDSEEEDSDGDDNKIVLYCTVLYCTVLTPAQVADMVAAMQEKKVPRGCYLIREGTESVRVV